MGALAACGAIIRIDRAEFLRIVESQDESLVVCAADGFFGRYFKYLTSYKGLVFYCTSGEELPLPRGTELIRAKKMWIPAV